MGALHAERMARFTEEVTLYPVSCEEMARGRSDYEWLSAVLEGGARIVQLRDKNADANILYKKALEFRRKTRKACALLIINDRLDIALAVDADGVHLGNKDLPVEAARQLAPDLIIGVSCNTEEQAAAAEARGASYYNVGPLFSTGTKKDITPILGPDVILRFRSRCSLPFTVMGGIKLHHVPELVARGARRLAVVTALTEADDIYAETRRWIFALARELEKVS